jgi:dihydroorotate dehydrogenase
MYFNVCRPRCASVWLGADLVQLYSGFIYRGPRLIREVAERLAP